jgi:hypothetical protein
VCAGHFKTDADAALSTVEPDTRVRRGAYGLELQGVEGAAHLLVPCPAHWTSIRLSRRAGRSATEAESIDDALAILPLRSGGSLVVDRTKGIASFTTPEALSDTALVHPFLAPVVAVMSRWLGRHAFHAGAFAHEGRVWIVFGDQGDGKSSLLAALALGGYAVVSDDVVVVIGEKVCAGPRTVDLREDAAQALQAGDPIGHLGFRERWRVPLGPIAPELPLGGWVGLEWGEKIEVARMPGPVLLQYLLGFHMLDLDPVGRAHLVDLLGFPGLVLRRPRELSAIGATVERLVEHL